MIKRVMKLGRTEQEERLYIEKPSSSLRSKAAHFVSDLTTVILNPISDKPSSSPPSPTSEDVINEPRIIQQDSDSEDKPPELVYGPDTSSFTAFLYSFLSPGKQGGESDFVLVSHENQLVANGKNDASPNVSMKESSGRKGLLSRGKQSLGRAVSLAARFGGYRSHSSGKVNSEFKVNDGDGEFSEPRMDKGSTVQNLTQPLALDILPEISEPSQLMTENTRASLYVSLPSLSQGKKWVLLYSTWRHGISLSTLYRRSNLCPGLSLLVVGDRRGAVFGGLVEAPLRPTTKKKYQGTNDTFVFTNTSGRPVIFHPTGVNRYFTLCSTDYLALGGGSHFALYIDGDLLNGSSLASETYGNSCLACSEEFEVKEIELWGFVYASKYEEMISMLRTEAPGICRF